VTAPRGGAERFVQEALAQAGDRYVFGQEARLDDPNPTAFDTAESATYHTDPLRADTNADGVADSMAVAAGGDPGRAPLPQEAADARSAGCRRWTPTRTAAAWALRLFRSPAAESPTASVRRRRPR